MGSRNNLFKTTFLVSLVFHALLFLPFPEGKKVKPKKNNQLKLNYFSIKAPLKKKIAKFTHKKIVGKVKSIDLKNKPASQALKTHFSKNTGLKKNEPAELKKIKEKAKKNQEIITRNKDLKKKEFVKNKSYISYYKLINAQLRLSIIYPPHFSEGEIALSFVLASDGKLKNVEVLQATSQEDTIIKETAMQIVRKASPFPPFPENLQQKQLTFNIVFCFKENS